jgi:hypothetical protein
MADEKSHEILDGEIVIEITHPRNNDLYFHPVSEKVRSAVIPARSGARVPDGFAAIARIPGQRIHLDPKLKRGRITDGLGAEQNKRIQEHVAVAVRNQQKFSSPISNPCKVKVFNLTQDQVDNWMYWMARAVEDKAIDPSTNPVDENGQIETMEGAKVPCAIVLKGQLLSPSEIAGRCKIPIPTMNPSLVAAESKTGFIKGELPASKTASKS